MKRLLLALLFLASPVFAAEDNVVNVYNWTEYMPEEVLQKFTQETGIKVNYSTYDSNEVLYAKLKTVGVGYDLVVPSTYFVNRMRVDGMLLKLDKARLPNFQYLDPKLLNKPYDPGNDYSIPYLWGTTGIAYNSKKIKPGEVRRYIDMWDPKYKGKVLLLDDMREVLGMGLKVLGYSINDTDERHIRDAYEKLKELMPNVKVFNAESPKVLFLEEEVTVGLVWNGEAYKAGKENPDIKYVYPLEGASLWMDNLVIPAEAQNVDNAYALLEFLMRPEVARIISENLGYATPNKGAMALIPKEFRDNRMVFPGHDDLKNSEFQIDVGEATYIYERYWEMLKVGRN
ncbi:MAG TPA: spermidine/putrescine ABC transporter substrate-binding protein PotD [Syntrophobacteraceae bacterium]|nr:spermidine/putrescine ABC transporter substrate-binding protein PotD [Syntrophobacteraceae bacterium]